MIKEEQKAEIIRYYLSIVKKEPKRTVKKTSDKFNISQKSI